MIDSMGKASNIGSVLMNHDVVKQIGIGINKDRKPTKIIAVLKNKNETEDIMKMFQQDFGCNFGCPSHTGIEADKDKGIVVIDGERVHDKEAFELVMGTLIMAAQIFSK
jgi:predicted site-specific integrase-resolvase